MTQDYYGTKRVEAWPGKPTARGPNGQDRKDDDGDFHRRGAFHRRTSWRGLAARTPIIRGLSVKGA